MKTVAIFKWAVNPDDALVRADGTVNWQATRQEVGDDDHAAIACAAEAAAGGEVIGLTLAGGDTAFAAARGAERTLVLEGLPAPADSNAVAQALADAVRDLGEVDVVTMGDAEWDPAVSGLVAGLLGWPAIMAVDAVKPQADELLVTRRYGTGTQEVVVKSPVLLDVAARREEEEKPGMRQVLAARKKPTETIPVNPEQTAFTSQGTQLPKTTASCLFDGSDPAEAAQQLLKALKAEGMI